MGTAGFAHGNLRLPNIYFDENYNPVLIDLDFSTPLDGNISNHISNQDMKMFTVT